MGGARGGGEAKRGRAGAAAGAQGVARALVPLVLMVSKGPPVPLSRLDKERLLLKYYRAESQAGKEKTIQLTGWCVGACAVAGAAACRDGQSCVPRRLSGRAGGRESKKETLPWY